MVFVLVVVVVFTPFRLRVDHGVLKVFDRDGGLRGEVPVSDVDMLVIVGRGVGLSSGVLLVLGRVDAPVVVHGRDVDVFVYRVFSVCLPSIRSNQYRASSYPEVSLLYAREFIRGKLAGLKNLLSYLASKGFISGCDEYLSCIEEELGLVDRAEALDRLRGVEAEGSKCFWRCVAGLFERYGFPGRVPRGRDVVNRAVDYGYAVLYGYIYHALVGAGLDPYAGFMHTIRSGRPSLVYDFSEQYKPFILHVVLSAVRRLKNPYITEEGLLDPSSISYITKTLQSWINRRRRGIGTSIRKNIYVKARELAEALRTGCIYTPFIYRVW